MRFEDLSNENKVKLLAKIHQDPEGVKRFKEAQEAAMVCVDIMSGLHNGDRSVAFARWKKAIDAFWAYADGLASTYRDAWDDRKITVVGK